MHPFLALMRKYCIDYTCSHDTSLLPEIMVEDYEVSICGATMARSGSYLEGVEGLFAIAPGLALSVHRIFFNGKRLAMLFSEHACFTNKHNRLAAWRGFATYDWDGSRLTKCMVEQDFYSRYRQLKEGVADTLPSPAIDPWYTELVPSSETSLVAAQNWLSTFSLEAVAEVKFDEADVSSEQRLAVQPKNVVVNDIFSVGSMVPFHATVEGPVIDSEGQCAFLQFCGVIEVGEDGEIERVEGVSDRFSLMKHGFIN
jgi:hypothetical protein